MKIYYYEIDNHMRCLVANSLSEAERSQQYQEDYNWASARRHYCPCSVVRELTSEALLKIFDISEDDYAIEYNIYPISQQAKAIKKLQRAGVIDSKGKLNEPYTEVLTRKES